MVPECLKSLARVIEWGPICNDISILPENQDTVGGWPRRPDPASVYYGQEPAVTAIPPFDPHFDKVKGPERRLHPVRPASTA